LLAGNDGIRLASEVCGVAGHAEEGTARLSRYHQIASALDRAKQVHDHLEKLYRQNNARYTLTELRRRT
jgi:hypothetical protein